MHMHMHTKALMYTCICTYIYTYIISLPNLYLMFSKLLHVTFFQFIKYNHLPTILTFISINVPRFLQYTHIVHTTDFPSKTIFFLITEFSHA